MKRPLDVKMVVALDDALGIGKDGELPWGHLPGDLARFKALTLGKGCVLGFKTFGTLPPLRGRHIEILTHRNLEASSPFAPGDGGVNNHVSYGYSNSIATAILNASLRGGHEVWICGGAQVYAAALEGGAVADAISEIHVTRVTGTHDADTFFPWARVEALGFTCAVDVRGQDAGTRWQIWRKV